MTLCIFAFSGDVMMTLFYILFGRMNTGIVFFFEDPSVFFKVLLICNFMLKGEGNKQMDSIRTKNEPSHLQEKPWKIHLHLCGLKNDFPLFQFRGTPSDVILYALECNLAKFHAFFTIWTIPSSLRPYIPYYITSYLLCLSFSSTSFSNSSFNRRYYLSIDIFRYLWLYK